MQLKNKTPRYYQSESAEAALKSIQKKGSNPICAVPTGAGKTIIICLIIIEYIKNNADKNILVVSHVKEILRQNYKELDNELNESIGLYSAGLSRKDVERVTVVGMQSGRNNPNEFKNVGLVIVDECHLVSEYDQGIYRNFLSNFNCNCIGVSATPFRASGYIHLSEEALFTEICYDLNSYENFNKLVKDGHLTQLYSKATDLKMEIPKGVGTVAGDYINNDLDILFNNERVTKAALEEVNEILKQKRYKKILIFCINILHAERTSDLFNEMGIKSDFVHSKMEGSRDEAIDKFKNGELDALTNVDVLTTGLDIPDIDMIVLLRPTKSISLYCQMVGRGLRTAEGKSHCLVLDFAGNVSRLGPVNDLHIDQKGKPKKGGDAPTKECPECGCINHPIAKNCIACNYKFKFEVKIQATHADLDITKRVEPKRLKVKSVSYFRHKKKNAADSFRIDFRVGLRKFSKWLAVESTTLYAAPIAESEIPNMLKKGETLEAPYTVDKLLKNQDKFKKPTAIVVDTNDKYPSIDEIIYEEEV